jgi:drug/metabolite transporter (DMT)-like permease
VYAKRRLADAPVLTLAFGQQLSAAVWLLVPGLATLPRVAPSAAAILALLALALVSTALAYVLFFWLLASAGAVKSSTSAFLIPAFGVLWGSLFLGERPTSGVLGGLACVLVSLVLVNGLPRFGGTTLEARTVDIRS